MICIIYFISVLTNFFDLPPSYNYIPVSEVDLSNKSAILVYGQISNDLHIGLLEAKGDYTANKMYEIVIGGWANSQSVIRYESEEVYRDNANNCLALLTSNFASIQIWR